ncbi:MAG TPA: YcxB family protein [Candidatus Limnocylindrales bacterium]|nr:YcxB family protein [Candidatus Limnocylindrales bacterium]
MRLEYQNALGDIVFFHIAHQLASAAMHGYLLVGSFMVAYLTTASSECRGAAPCTETFSFVLLMTYLLVLTAQLLFSAINLFHDDNRASLTRHVVDVSDAGVGEYTVYQHSVYSWEGILKVVSVAGFVAIYVSPHTALVVPPRAFTTQRERGEFLALVRSHIHAARIEQTATA